MPTYKSDFRVLWQLKRGSQRYQRRAASMWAERRDQLLLGQRIWPAQGIRRRSRYEHPPGFPEFRRLPEAGPRDQQTGLRQEMANAISDSC